MKKQYFYRKHIRMMYKGVPIFFGILAALIFIGSIFEAVHLAQGDTFFTILIITIGVIISLLLLMPAAFAWFFFGRFTKISVTLTDDEIIYKNVNGETKIPIGEIQRLEFPSIQYAGGWITIISSRETIRLTVVLENIGDFVKNLKELLDQRGAQHTYNRNAMFSFYKTSAYSDQSWERLYEIFLKMSVQGIVLAILSVFAGIKLGKIMFIHWLVIGALVFPLMAFCMGELILALSVGKQADEERFEVKPRDKIYEKKIYTLCFVICFLIFLLFSIALCML